MRHAKLTVKLGRKAEHRNLLLANQVCSLIQHNRIKTTLAKAKAVRPLAEKMITLGKRGDLNARRVALSVLGQKDVVRKLFAEVAPRAGSRQGGYVRIVKLGPRLGDSAPMAYLEWVDQPQPEQKVETEKPAEKK
jgi:large subunit ribosomal protein L17